MAEESLATWWRLGESWGICRPLGTLANPALLDGDAARARALEEQRLEYAQQAGDTLEIARVHCYLGRLAAADGEYGRARELLEASYDGFADLGNKEGMAHVLSTLAPIAGAEDNRLLAKRLWTESLVLFRKLGAMWGIAECLTGVARLAAQEGRRQLAAQLSVGATAVRERYGLRLADDQMVEFAAASRKIRPLPSEVPPVVAIESNFKLARKRDLLSLEVAIARALAFTRSVPAG
jgi:hypothetical protein